jgi:acyl-CoA synthetase (AMP-forming)/AMP-acid ligase II
MPLFHVHGLIGALLSSLAARSSALVCAFSASNFWKLFLEHDCSWYSAVPTIHQILLKHEKDVGKLSRRGRLRFIRSCSSSLPPSVFKQLEDTYGVPVLEAYAMTEAAHQMTSNPLPPLKRKPGSVGLPQGVQVRIINGEVCVRGTNVTRGYINRPEANKESFLEGGWFRTGDQGYKDEEGFLYLTGRLKELINRGGEKIAPLEIDHVLLGVKGVSEAVCFGVKDKVYGEEVHAAVVLRNDARGVTEESLKKHCQLHLASFKVPKKIHIVDQVPKTPTGKVQRRFVAAHFAGDGMKEKCKL